MDSVEQLEQDLRVSLEAREAGLELLGTPEAHSLMIDDDFALRCMSGLESNKKVLIGQELA
jgi:hypothetical protein